MRKRTSIWRVFSLFYLSVAITAFGGPEGYFNLAIRALGAFVFIVPKYDHRLGQMDIKESRLLKFRRFRSSRVFFYGSQGGAFLPSKGLGASRQHQCDLMKLAWLQLVKILDLNGATH